MRESNQSERGLSSTFFPNWLRHFGFDDLPILEGSSLRGDLGYSLSEDAGHVYLELPMPGVETNDINITHDHGLLRVGAAAGKEEQTKDRKYYSRSRYNYSFTFTIPSEVDDNKEVEATYENGVLHLKFAKVSRQEPKRITVQKREG